MTPELIHITRESGIPLLGVIPFGIISRGNNNMIQVRPTSICNLKCTFCSTSANDFKLHPVNYVVELDYLLDYVKEVINFKGAETIVFIDSVGEPTTYPKFVELVDGLSKIKNVKEISVVTNGTLLNEDKIKALERAGLTKINLSLHSLDKNLARSLMGFNFYDVNKVIETAKLITSSKIKLWVTPVYIPTVNEKDIEEIIKFCKDIGAEIRIQKYEVYKYGRKMKVNKQTYYQFYKNLEEWEKKYGMKLKFGCSDLRLKKTKKLPIKFNKDEKAQVEVKAKGWMPNQMIAVARNRALTVFNCDNKIGEKIKVKILANINNIYVAENLSKKPLVIKEVQ